MNAEAGKVKSHVVVHQHISSTHRNPQLILLLVESTNSTVPYFSPDHKASMPGDKGPWTYLIHECTKKGLCSAWPVLSSFSRSRLHNGLGESFHQTARLRSTCVENERDISCLDHSCRVIWCRAINGGGNLFYSVILIKGFWNSVHLIWPLAMNNIRFFWPVKSKNDWENWALVFVRSF